MNVNLFLTKFVEIDRAYLTLTSVMRYLMGLDMNHERLVSSLFLAYVILTPV